MDELTLKYNLSMKKSMESKHNKNLRQIYDSPLGRTLIGAFLCECGSFLSPSTMRFYNFDFTKTKCWECQKKKIEVTNSKEKAVGQHGSSK